MIIIREKTTGLVPYLFESGTDVLITEKGLRKPFKALDIKPDTHEILEVAPPTHIKGGLWRYDNGWHLASQEYLGTLKDLNKASAQREQEKIVQEFSKNEARKALGLPPSIGNETDIKEYAKTIQADIDYPSESEAYNPPLPPGATPPAVSSLMVKITRQEGWQGAIGWKAVLTAGEENFTPANLAIAEYKNPDCDGYLYTTGAFQEADGEYFAVCPPGQEKGDVDINLGILYGSAPLSCFTLKAGVREQTIYAYEEV